VLQAAEACARLSKNVVTFHRQRTMKVYYWPFLARSAGIVRILEHTGTPYEYISDKVQLDKVCSAWGAEGNTFAPPVVVDGDYVVSQSIAATLYVGKKLLMCKDYDDFKAIQFCGDIVDTFEGGVGKNNEDGKILKGFLEGPRFARLMGNVERGIKGPYYFGDEPSGVDFFLLMHLDWRYRNVFNPLKDRYGVDVMKDYPKMAAIYTTLTATEAYKAFDKMKPPGPIKDEILEAYNS